MLITKNWSDLIRALQKIYVVIYALLPFRPLLLRADSGKDAPIPLPNVTAKILAKVIEYCKYHVEAESTEGGGEGANPKSDEDVKAWDTDFVKVDQGTLFELILVRAAASHPCDGGIVPGLASPFLSVGESD